MGEKQAVVRCSFFFFFCFRFSFVVTVVPSVHFLICRRYGHWTHSRTQHLIGRITLMSREYRISMERRGQKKKTIIEIAHAYFARKIIVFPELSPHQLIVSSFWFSMYFSRMKISHSIDLGHRNGWFTLFVSTRTALLVIQNLHWRFICTLMSSNNI